MGGSWFRYYHYSRVATGWHWHYRGHDSGCTTGGMTGGTGTAEGDRWCWLLARHDRCWHYWEICDGWHWLSHRGTRQGGTGTTGGDRWCQHYWGARQGGCYKHYWGHEQVLVPRLTIGTGTARITTGGTSYYWGYVGGTGTLLRWARWHWHYWEVRQHWHYWGGTTGGTGLPKELRSAEAFSVKQGESQLCYKTVMMGIRDFFLTLVGVGTCT